MNKKQNVVFICRTSGKNSREFLEWFKYFTPNHSGVWKNIIGKVQRRLLQEKDPLYEKKE